MKIKLIALSAVFAAVSFGISDLSDQQAEAVPIAPTVVVDFTKYSSSPELTGVRRGETCTTFNAGSPFCYMMCDRSPFLRSCEE